jgi:tetratricopeptide (TPR) repeat protein
LLEGANSGVSSSAPQDIAHAEQLLLEAIEREPNRSMAHQGMGFLRRNQKDRLQEAQIELETAVALDPNNLDAVGQLGWNSVNTGDPDACIVQAEKRLRLSPHDPFIWGTYAQLGVCHLALNRVDLSTDYLIKARTENPSAPWWVHYYLAGALALKGDFDGARVALAQSLKLKPQINSISQFYLLKAWYNDPKLRAIDDKTLNEGLRRIGFPEK